MSEKLGWFKFYPGDWSRDLEEHPPEIEGYWIRICCKLSWEPDRGQAAKSLEQWARVMRVIDLEEARKVIAYLRQAGIADVTGDPWNTGEPIAIVSRRMVRDERERRGNAIRQERHRKKVASLPGDIAASDTSCNGAYHSANYGANYGADNFAGNGGGNEASNGARDPKSSAAHNTNSNAASNGTSHTNSNGPPNAPTNQSDNDGLTPENQESEKSKELFPPAPKREAGGVRRGKSIPKLARALGDEEHRLHELAVWFEEILWASYPPRRGRKTGKAEAWEWLARGSPDADGLNRMEAKLREDLASPDWQRGIGIKDCHRWLKANDKNGWESTLAKPEQGDDPYEGLDD